MKYNWKRRLAKSRRYILNRPKRFVFGTVIVLWLTCLGVMLLLFRSDGNEMWTHRGQAGDMFGTINALFSGLALGGIILTILLQHQELKLQRKELKLTRNEFSKQSEAFEKQNEMLNKQNFDSTFFQLLQSQNEIIRLMEFRDEDNKLVSSGRGAIQSYFEELEFLFDEYKIEFINTHRRDVASYDVEDKIDLFHKRYQMPTSNQLKHFTDEIFEPYEGDLGHYFRNLYQIVRFVHEDGPGDKRTYMRLIRAKLSTFELALLFYNCLTYGKFEFKPLIERYRLLKNLNWDFVGSHKILLEYDPDAYGIDAEKIEHVFYLSFEHGLNRYDYRIAFSSNSRSVHVSMNSLPKIVINVGEHERNFNRALKGAWEFVFLDVCLSHPEWIHGEHRKEVIEKFVNAVYRMNLIAEKNEFPSIVIEKPILGAVDANGILKDVFGYA